MQNSRGFTLIELMIVIVIIAVLAAVAMASYQNFVSKTQVTAALAEIAPGKNGIEMALANGQAALVDATYVGLASATSHCSSVLATLTPDGSAQISCVVAGNSRVAGADITLNRDVAGEWTCATPAISELHRPMNCH